MVVVAAIMIGKFEIDMNEAANRINAADDYHRASNGIEVVLVLW